MLINLQKLVSRRQALLTDDIIVNSWKDTARFKMYTGVETQVNDFEIIDGDCYFEMNWMDRLTKDASSWPREKSLYFIEQGIVHGERLRSFARERRTFSSIDESVELFWQSIELLKNLLVFLPITHPLAKAAEQQVIAILEKKGLTDTELNDTLLQISRPTKDNGPTLEEKALQEIKRQAAQNSTFNVEKALNDHAHEFAYLGYREPFSEGYSLDFFRERYEELKENKTRINPTLPSFTEDEQKTIELLQDFVFFRNYRTEKLYEALFYLEPLWKHLASHHGLKETNLGWHRIEECRDLFEQNKKVDEAVIETRKAGHGFLLHDNKIILIVGTELADKKKSMTVPEEKPTRLNGMSACRGRVQGPVKVVHSAKEQDKVEAGDILVTSMTTPDYLPAMKRAAAFVTDEGGITCHAAIVSRELGKPCVIGTKNATSTFQDGQIVFVDGDQGIVEVVN